MKNQLFCTNTDKQILEFSEGNIYEHAICVRIIALPPKVYGVTVRSSDFFNIYLNASISPEKRHRALLHELSHIEKRHFDSDILTIEEKEAEAEVDEMREINFNFD